MVPSSASCCCTSVQVGRSRALVRSARNATNGSSKNTITVRRASSTTINDAEKVKFALGVAADVCGEHAISDDVKPSMGAEDFSYMLEQVPGAMVMLGNGGGPEAVSLHNPRYDFNDEILTTGAAYWVNLVQLELGDPT